MKIPSRNIEQLIQENIELENEIARIKLDLPKNPKPLRLDFLTDTGETYKSMYFDNVSQISRFMGVSRQRITWLLNKFEKGEKFNSATQEKYKNLYLVQLE